jgi:hypothetical protein
MYLSGIFYGNRCPNGNRYSYLNAINLQVDTGS